jgi:LCP family protein required for cell wall assembly
MKLARITRLRSTPRTARQKLKRAFLAMCAFVVASTLAITGLGAAWLAGYKLPFASGATYLSVQKLQPAGDADRSSSPTAPFFALLIGNDDRPGVGGARGDALHLVGVNPEQRKATIINIPRDTCWNGDKINAANTQGGRLASAAAVGGLAGVSVSYVVEVNFDKFRALVDGVGGVMINVPTEMHDSYSGAYFQPGMQKMNGEAALSFSRDRHDFPSSDIIRTGNQGLLILSAITQLQQQATTAGGQFRLISLLYQHANLSGLGLSDLYDLGRVMYRIQPGGIRNATIPIGGGGCLSLGNDAAGFFADFRDDAVLESH